MPEKTPSLSDQERLPGEQPWSERPFIFRMFFPIRISLVLGINR